MNHNSNLNRMLLGIGLAGWAALSALAADENSVRDEARVAAHSGSDLRILYVGNAGSPRAAAYEDLLTQHFAQVHIAERTTFDPTSANAFDIVLLDWSQRDVDIMKMGEITSPLGPREQWNKPTVLLGSAGLLIAGPWQTAGAYG